MRDRLIFWLNRLRERLWIKPLIMCLFSVAVAFAAQLVDFPAYSDYVPEITTETIEMLLQIIAASMLVISTFAVGSMVSSYASASATATPRAFRLVVSDDRSQNALSVFIGAFIFSIVALVALKNGIYGAAGRFALFLVTLVFFAAVILTFLRWVDSVARLGRLGTTIDKVQAAALAALDQRRRAPTLRGVAVGSASAAGTPVHTDVIGHVQRVDVATLQGVAERAGLRIAVATLPGAFVTPDRVLAYVRADGTDAAAAASAIEAADAVAAAFVIGEDRTFEEDPRFGLVVLSEIASRALSPAVNDPGTAIVVLNTFVRLFDRWVGPRDASDPEARCYDRVEVPELSARDLVDDAFTAIARDGAGTVEVCVRLHRALSAIAALGDPALRAAAEAQSCTALARAEQALTLPDDREAVRSAAQAVHAH